MPGVTAPHPESFRAVASRERARLDMTVEDLAYEIKHAASKLGHGDRSGASVSSVQKHLAGTLKSSPSVGLMEATASVLGIQPDAFGEYRLAMARRAIDESVVGLDVALERLKRIESRRPPKAPRTGRDQRQNPSTSPRPRAAGQPKR